MWRSVYSIQPYIAHTSTHNTPIQRKLKAVDDSKGERTQSVDDGGYVIIVEESCVVRSDSTIP
ncbi:hypothetical protein BC937DRAFT_91014 [Endogone sp. FLAS-F59071]|nr:hypothetical protein BC937DRAFT_91014 [Endogone sp. FLAS-F59071]|eukprot:RUS21931.1 hypothetical protein BC937DRAFT_91014 [Endogone sp. FLAS-F59071]